MARSRDHVLTSSGLYRVLGRQARIVRLATFSGSMSSWERRGDPATGAGGGPGRHPVPSIQLGPAGGGGVPRGAGGGLSEGGAESFASEGFAALALAYFGLDGLPRELVEIPLEYFEGAIAWLKRHPMVEAGRVVVVGNSKGGELALLLGATFPRDVGTVVGYAPSAVVWQGIAFDHEVYHGGPRSPWPSVERRCRSSRWRGPVLPR